MAQKRTERVSRGPRDRYSIYRFVTTVYWLSWKSDGATAMLLRTRAYTDTHTRRRGSRQDVVVGRRSDA